MARGDRFDAPAPKNGAILGKGDAMTHRKAISDAGAAEVRNPMVTLRGKSLAVIAVILLALMLCRVLFLQTAGFSEYQQKVLDQMTTESSVTASRGNIYDRNGAILASTVTTYRVFISPSEIAAQQTEHDRQKDDVCLDDLIAKNLSSILGVSYDFVIEQTGYTRYLDRTIKRGVDKDTADRVRAFISEYGLHRMIYLEANGTRYYPNGSLASQTLGFTGSDGTGLYGLEYQYNDLLSGTDGRYLTARDARGNEMPYSYKEYVEPESGKNLHTTLDVSVQAALDEQLAAAYTDSNGQNRATGIVMDVNTGAILGLSVYPSFDLNDPWTLDAQSERKLETSGLDPDGEEYEKLRQELLLRMWSNKAITDAYIPGSTFKVVTASMALEEAVVTLNETYTCTGSKTVLGHIIHCHKTAGHGTLTFPEGIQQSCNPWLMTLGLRLGTDTFYEYLKAFGYLEKTGVDLPGEGSSIVAAKDAFTDLDLAIYAFGQNFNVTAIQQITAVAAVANSGYLVIPHLVSSATDEDGNTVWSFGDPIRRQIISEETCATVSKILEEGVSGNGGAKNAYVAGFRIAAKTGTSEKKDSGNVDKYICSTVAYAPADNPQYAVIIIVDEPTSGVLYGSTVAAPYVANVMKTILPYLGVEEVYSEEELAKKAVKVPNLVSWSVSAAEKACKNLGLSVEVIGDRDRIIQVQYPSSGTVIEKASGKVILYTERDAELQNATVPNTVGMTAVAANQTCVNAGLNVRIVGTKNYLSGTDVKVISQSLAAGETVPRGTVIELCFRSLEADETFEDFS